MLRRHSAFVLTSALLTACGGGGAEAGATTNEQSDSGGEESLSDFLGFGDDDSEACQAEFVREQGFGITTWYDNEDRP